jgi:hypothetical protein
MVTHSVAARGGMVAVASPLEDVACVGDLHLVRRWV